jgi:LmbE family N-acetylglucosaminyl deacetylase
MLWLISMPFLLWSQSPKNWTSAEILQGLQKLNVLGTVLYVAAHPDDENTRLIAYLSKERLYRTGYLSMTRGDGGQNLIGDEQGIELGLIRTQELLAARRIDGGEQFFTRAFDFGFSKGPEETFTKWHKEIILGDVVWVIRKFQPDVIITRFPTTGEGGHGHHTASAILANEAFAAAADPNRFPEQLKYVKPWQVKRVVWNSFNFGNNPPAGTAGPLRLDVGGYNPLLGKSYGEIAAESRSQHKSQGFGVPAGRGEALEYFTTTAGTAPKTDLMEDVDISWSKVKNGQAVSQMVDELARKFDMRRPELSVPGLVALYNTLNTLEEGYWKVQKLREVKELIAQCSGLYMDAATSTQFAVQTDSLRVNFSFNNRLGSEAVLQKISLDGFDSTLAQNLGRNRNLNISKTIYIPADKPLTQPYWLANRMSEGYFNVDDPLKIGQPDIDPSFVAKFNIAVAGTTITYEIPVSYRHTDPVKGELYQPLVVLPVVTFDGLSSVYLKNNKDQQIDLTIYPNKDAKNAKKPAVQDSGDTVRMSFTYDLKKNVPVHYPLPIASLANKVYGFSPGDGQAGKIRTTIEYDHIPSITYFKDAITSIRQPGLKIYNKKIGYITGAGDKVAEALEQMGYEVTILSDKELSRNNLSQFDAIITGIRAYNTNPWMNNFYDRLMKYVNDGGNLIVQYNTSSNIGPVRAKMAPYNFNISRTRVTDENATVTFLKPEHPVLNFPNKISADDFKGWVQERSIYHASGWDTTKFETVLSMNDPGEKPDDGSLIIARYGKGYFTYTGLVFFRELPAGVDGAYRLLANLIALNRKKGF